MPFEAKLSKGRVALMGLGCVLLVIVGLWLLGALGTAPADTSVAREVKRLVAGWAALLLGGLALPISVSRLFQSGVEVRVDSVGIYWRRWSDRVIPWSAIRRIETAKVQRQRFACLSLYDPEAHRANGIAGRVKRLSKALGSARFGDIAVGVTGTDRSFDEMMAAVQHYAPAQVCEAGADS